MVDGFGALPPGRLLWEGNTQLNVYGSPLALMLLPYWTDERITSMEGLYYEASATTPYHFMVAATVAAPGNASNAVRGVPYRDFSQFSTMGVPRLQVLGVRYLAVHSDQAKASADADHAPATGRDDPRRRRAAALGVERVPRRRLRSRHATRERAGRGRGARAREPPVAASGPSRSRACPRTS